MKNICKIHSQGFKIALRQNSLKATPARIELLDIFAHTKRPISIQELKEKLSGKTDLATLYRNAETLSETGFLKRIRLQDKKDYYEFSGQEHHHHLVCTNCGKLEDITNCKVQVAPQLGKSSGFSKITNHSLEFFGLCKACDK